jgi:hypothetical protein
MAIQFFTLSYVKLFSSLAQISTDLTFDKISIAILKLSHTITDMLIFFRYFVYAEMNFGKR